MGYERLSNYAGEYTILHDSYIEKWEDDFIEKIATGEDAYVNYKLGWVFERREKVLEDKIKVLEGEVAALQRTPEEKAEEELFIKNFVENNR